MLPYLIKRILLFIPTLWVISLLVFLISAYSPVDPIANKCPDFALGVSHAHRIQCLQREKAKYRLDQPVFYFEIGSWAEPDTLYRIFDEDLRLSLERLLDQYGNWQEIQIYFQNLLRLQNAFFPLKGHTGSQSFEARQRLQKTLETTIRLSRAKPLQIPFIFKQLSADIASDSLLFSLRSPMDAVITAFLQIKNQATPWKTYIPKIIWHGSQNRYHNWISGIITRGDFGVSFSTGLPITDRIKSIFFWSFIFALLSTLIVYALGIPMGILAAVKQGGWWDRLSAVGVFALSSIPNFWFATLLLFFFANTDMLNWFYSSFNTINASVGEQISGMVLPLIAYSYGGFAFVSRTMRASLLEISKTDFIRTARAKGLNTRQIVTGHMLKNALLPIATVFVSVFPALISGSVILEHIFGIPGMGNEIHSASLNNDIPMILTVFTLSGFLTLAGYLIADLLYVWLDPRIKLSA